MVITYSKSMDQPSIDQPGKPGMYGYHIEQKYGSTG